MKRLISIMAVMGTAFQAPAQPTGQIALAEISAAEAQAIIEGCADHARARNRSFAIAVVDRGGHLVVALRMDTRRSGMMDFAIEKARAAAAWGFATSGMEAGARTTPGFAFAPGVVTVAGGVPVYDATGRYRIGAVGASGGAPVNDEACALAGIEAAGLRSALSD